MARGSALMMIAENQGPGFYSRRRFGKASAGNQLHHRAHVVGKPFAFRLR